jgi:hypothetical protein
MTIDVEIHGLKPFVAHLKAFESGLQKEMRKVHNAAAQIVVQDARPSVPKVSGTAARSVKAQSTQRQSRVVGGGNKAPYYGWLDFGGWGGTNKANYRPIIQEGRYIYASYHRHEDEFSAIQETGIRRLAAASGLDIEAV